MNESRPMPLLPRTSRCICREACAIERPAPRRSLGHSLIVAACVLALVGLCFVF